MSNFIKLKEAVASYVTTAGVEIYDPENGKFGEVDPEFLARMVSAMMVSYFKYGRVRDAYPHKFNARADVRTRFNRFLETGNRNYLVDAANFCMIESMCPTREAFWGPNASSDSPGRNASGGRRLVQEDNQGNRIIGETILHHPND